MPRQTLGARIAQARRELAVQVRKDLTQADIAKMVGTTAATMSRWESDVATPKEDALAKLAKALGVTPAYLRYGVVEQSRAHAARGPKRPITLRGRPSRDGESVASALQCFATSVAFGRQFAHDSDMTDRLLTAFLAARRLRPDQQEDLASRILADIATSEGERDTETYRWAFQYRTLIHTSDERQPRNDPERRLRTG